MKKFNLSMVALLTMGGFAVAGGDIASVENPIILIPIAQESSSAFYLGLGYGMANYDGEGSGAYGGSNINLYNYDYDTVMLQAGYRYNSFIAVEGRYWSGFEADICTGQTLKIDTWGVYLKPTYPVTDAFDIYALVGYVSTDLEISGGGIGAYTPAYDLDGFSWGVGGAYALSETLSLFVEYTSLYDGDNTFTDGYAIQVTEKITSVNFGVTYRF